MGLRVSDLQTYLKAPRHRAANFDKWKEIAGFEIEIYGDQYTLNLHFTEHRHHLSKEIYQRRHLLCPRCVSPAIKIYFVPGHCWCNQCG